MTMGKPNYGDRYKAHATLMVAKRRMDEAFAAYETTEAEWLKAVQECNRLDSIAGEDVKPK